MLLLVVQQINFNPIVFIHVIFVVQQQVLINVLQLLFHLVLQPQQVYQFHSPISQLSQQPFRSPSSHPSCQPTIYLTNPTSQPSSFPTNPTMLPTSQPSSFPSHQPTIRPTRQLPSQPTIHPSQ
jgi:hypothetical protein